MTKVAFYIITTLFLLRSVNFADTISCVRSFPDIKKNFSIDYRFIGQKGDFAVGGEGSMSVLRPNSKPDIFRLNTQNDLNFISFVDDSNGFIVGTKGTVFHSQDAGKTWVEQNSNTKEDLNSIFCLDRNSCWIVGINGIVLKTANGGKSWQMIGSGQTKRLSSVAFISKNKGWAIGAEGLVLQTANGGKSWKKVENVDFQPTNMLNENGTWWETIKFFNRSFGCFAGYNRIVCTTNGGKTWNKTEIKNEKESYYFKSFSTINNKPAVIEECGKDFISNDFGKNWIRKK